jgi:hypothetical protein
MKALMILGALVGFLIGSSFGLAGRSSWPTALWHASAAALVAAVLTRWWCRIWLQGLQESLIQRRNSRPAAVPNGKPIAKT